MRDCTNRRTEIPRVSTCCGHPQGLLLALERPLEVKIQRPAMPIEELMGRPSYR